MDLSFHKRAFLYGKSLSFILFILAFGGIVVAAPQYLDLLGLILRYYVCAFLLIRFNPIFEIKTRDHDFERKVAFSAGVFLFHHHHYDHLSSISHRHTRLRPTHTHTYYSSPIHVSPAHMVVGLPPRSTRSSAQRLAPSRGTAHLISSVILFSSVIP